MHHKCNCAKGVQWILVEMLFLFAKKKKKKKERKKILRILKYLRE